MGIVVCSILLVLLVLLFLRDIRQHRAPLVFALRILMILLMSLVLLGYVFRRTVKERPALDLLVLADGSQSMSAENKLSAEAAVLAGLPRKAGWRMGTYEFGDTTRRLENPKQMKADMPRTDMTQALKLAQLTRPGAAVLVSDGNHNAASDPGLVARKLGFPVYCVGVGRKPVRDLALERVRSPNRVVLGDTFPVAVRFRSRGFAGDKVRVRLLDNGRTLETRELVLGAEESQQEAEFRVAPASEGRHSYRVLADSLKGEDSYANNQSQIGVLVVPARTRVLYITNHPGFNTRILLQLARQNPDIELVPLVALTGNRLQRIGATGSQDYRVSPLDADVVILDDVDESTLGLSDALNTFAASQGLLVLGGERFRAGKALSALLPLEPAGDRVTRDMKLELTEDGRANPVLFDGTRNLLSDAPPFWGVLRTRSPRSDARVWARDKDGTPLIAFRRNGSGKVLEFAGYPLWRAGFSVKAVETGSRDLARLLANVIRFLALKDVDRFRLTSDKLDYFAGEPVSFLLQAVSDDGRPWTGLDARLAVAGASQAMVERGDGVYEAVVEGLNSGTHTASVEVFAQERSQGTVHHEVTVAELSLELSQTGLNDELLRRIAQATGGSYVHADSLGATRPELKLAEYRRTITFDPRLNRWLFLAIAGLFVLEILLRKRRGMQ
jgi:hypothetical protein